MSAQAALPSGVVTFLFTDVEGSTRRWEADAQAMRVALSRHDEVLRAAVAAHGGFLFKHTGDGVCAAFSSPTSAVEAAVAAQRELELPVRMGIATGEAELRDSDYFGTVLNRAARLMAAGHGGQILVADSTVRLLRGVDVADLGSHSMRDVPEPVGVFQVRAPGLAVDFPPLRTLTRPSGNVRAPVSALIGRDADLLKVAGLVRRHRIVTLTGVGGVGKTRLAVEVAQRLGDEFPDGTWLLELATVSDPDAVPNAIASVLGVSQQPGSSVSESLAEAMEGRTQLLVVDNCEHLRDAVAELVDTILVRARTVRVLATSREGLGLDDEQLWAVPSLDVEAGVESAAVDLFVDRARAVVSEFELCGAVEESAAVEICRRLDGIPLAIELAASRMASMSVSEVHDRLGQRFRLLVGSRRGLERHQTLRHTVAWSFDLLSPAEREVLQRCSAFTGDFDLAAAVAVAGCGVSDEFQILDALDALVRKSLIVVHRSGSQTRYSMLETIRQFAEEQLVADGLADDARLAHAAHFAARYTELESLWDSPRQGDAYAWFMAELPNLRSAFRWAADEAQLDLAAAIATYGAFLGAAVENLEPVTWVEELIPSASAAEHPSLALLHTLASQCWMPGRAEDSARYSDAALNALSVRPMADMPFGMDGLLGAGYLVSGQPARAVDCYRLRLACGTDSKGLNRVGLTLALAAVGDPEGARSVVEGIVDDPELRLNPYFLSFAQMAYAAVLVHTDPHRALEVARSGLKLAQESGNRTIATHLISILSLAAASCGNTVAALDQISAVIPHYLEGGNLTNLRTSLAILSTILSNAGQRDTAAAILGFATNQFVLASIPETGATISDLRDNLGSERFEALRLRGETMTVPEIVAFAEREIADLRAKLMAT